jgi:hypothetical protein
LIIINKNHLNLFKRLHKEYIYPVSKGIYLAFDIDTLEYLGVEMFYLASNKVYELADEKLKQLVALDILELR